MADSSQTEDVASLDYAQAGATVKRPRLPGPMLYRAKAAIIVGFLLAIGGWLVSIITLVLMAFLAMLVFIGALISCRHASLANRNEWLTDLQRVPEGSIRRHMIVAMLGGAVAVGSFLSGYRVFDRAAMHVSASSVSMANLRGIANALAVYYADHSAPADSFASLNDELLSVPKMFIDPADRSPSLLKAKIPAEYSSYIYFPVDGQISEFVECHDIVVALTREPYFIDGSDNYFAARRRSVLFADAHTVLVTDRELAVLLKADKKARRKLGWPVYEWDETTNKVVLVSEE